MKELAPAEIERIRAATEQILAETGLHVMHQGLLERARAAGAQVDEHSGTVRLPPPLLRELLAQVPTRYDIAGLDGIPFTVGGAQQGCLAIVTDPWIIDYQTQRPRRPCLEDLRRHTIIAQQLEPVVAVSRMDFPVSDVPGPSSSLRALEAHLLNYSKHIYVLPTSFESLQQWLEIGEILTPDRDLAGSRLITVGVPILSPLTLTGMNADILIAACAHDFPVVSTICPMAGTTGPYSKIGTLLLGNAENIFLAALAQIIRPGQPYLYALGPSVTDMRSGGDMYYTLDKVLWKLAAAQLGHAYHMPVTSECGGTMTYRYDQQNGAEGMLFMLAACQSKASILAGIGSCYNANGMSAEMMLIHTAWLEAARFLSQGIDLDLLDASVASIQRVGPGGHYLTDDLTLERLRSGEFYAHPLFDHSGAYGPYPSLLQRAHGQVEEMVAGFQSPVPERIQEGLRRYFHDQCARDGL